MRLSVEANQSALLVLADNWFPAWKAIVDGVESPVLRANHTLRAVPVPPGTSEVEVYYDVGSLKGAFLASLASLAVLGLMAALGYRNGRPRGSGAREEAEVPGGDGGSANTEPERE